MTCAGAGFSHVVTVTPPKRRSPRRFHCAKAGRWAPRIETSNARGNRVSSPRASRSSVAMEGPNVSRPMGSAQRGAKATRSSACTCPATQSRADFQSDCGTTERVCTA